LQKDDSPLFDRIELLKGTALMTEAPSTSETSVNFYHTTLRNNPEDSHLHTRRRENLKLSYCYHGNHQGQIHRFP
jgi:hypothetical protein